MTTANAGIRPRRAGWSVVAKADLRMLLGVVLVAVSLGGGLFFWSALRQTKGVLVTTKDINVGQVLGADDLAVARVRLEGPLAALAIPEERLEAALGRASGTRIPSGAMVLWPDLRDTALIGAGQVAITVPVKPESVYAGIQPGDVVLLAATRAKGKAESSTATLVESALVYAVTRETRSIAIGRDRDGADLHGITNLTLVVQRSEVERVAHAVVNWDVTVALVSAIDAATGVFGTAEEAPR